MHDESLLEGQKAYYRARAPEYDEWFERRGRYDMGPELNRRWADEVAEVEAALAAFGPHGHVLELAAGTGWWTERLARLADRVTAVDASPETLELNRLRLAGAGVDYLVADLFRLRPEPVHDVVFFSFWLSHVPESRFDAFWESVRAALRPGGRVFFVDSLRVSTTTAIDQPLPPPGDPVARRRLNDGREFDVVKVFYDPGELEARLRGLGWDVAVGSTDTYFLYGAGGPTGRASASAPAAGSP